MLELIRFVPKFPRRRGFAKELLAIWIEFVNIPALKLKNLAMLRRSTRLFGTEILLPIQSLAGSMFVCNCLGHHFDVKFRWMIEILAKSPRSNSVGQGPSEIDVSKSFGWQLSRQLASELMAQHHLLPFVEQPVW